MVIVDHLTYRAIIIEILKLPRNCKMLLLLLKPLVKRSRVISICLVRLQQPSYFVFIKIKKMSVLLPLRHIYRMLFCTRLRKEQKLVVGFHHINDPSLIFTIMKRKPYIIMLTILHFFGQV